MGVLDVLNPALVLKLRLVVYGVLIFFSFFIFVGTAVMKDKVDDLHISCPLYLSIDNKNRYYDEGPESNCNYPMAISIIYQLLYLLFRIGTLVLVLLGKFTADMVLFSDLAELVYVIVDLSAFFLIFIAACILSAGTNYTCDKINCSYPAFKDALSASKAAQAGAWISTFLWLFIGICGFLTLWRAGKIPFLSGGGAAKADPSTTGPDSSQPPIETPPYNPDDPPKY